MSVIRLRSKNKERLVELGEKSVWFKGRLFYLLEGCGGLYRRYATPHSDLIARKRDGQFELDIVLRATITPLLNFLDGVYHPHADVQHIKNINID